MAGKKREKIRQQDVQGLKYFRRLLPLFERLHEVGCERDRAGNRQLHFDQYCALILLYLFNPAITSLRGLQQASELKNVQRKLGCARSSLGSLSEATDVFDPQRLQEIIAELQLQLKPLEHDSRLDEIPHLLTAVDGTLLKKLVQISQASFLRAKPGPARDGWRLHTHFEVVRGVPVQMDLTDARNRHGSNEKAVLATRLQADRCYVLDRGYEQFGLLNAIVAAGSSYVCRVRNDHHFNVHEHRPLSAEAISGGVLEDTVGTLGSPKSARIEHPDHVMRQIRIRGVPHPKRGGRRRAAARQDVVVVTNLLDVPAEIVALIYRYRWTIEIFFRFFKHILGCRHLLSQDPVGIEIETYCAIIACMLISLWTGRKPTLRTYEMICHYFSGWADEEELLAHLAKLAPAEA